MCIRDRCRDSYHLGSHFGTILDPFGCGSGGFKMVFLVILGLLKFVKNSPIKRFKTFYYCPIIISPAYRPPALQEHHQCATGQQGAPEEHQRSSTEAVEPTHSHPLAQPLAENKIPPHHIAQRGNVGDILSIFRRPKMTRKTILNPPKTQPI